jgi:hypothetical protein
MFSHLCGTYTIQNFVGTTKVDLFNKAFTIANASDLGLHPMGGRPQKIRVLIRNKLVVANSTF